MSKVFEAPLTVSSDPKRRVFEIFDKNDDLVASDITDIVQAIRFSAVQEMYEALESVCLSCQLRDHEADCFHCITGKALRKARGESEVQ